jgi:hypothetical protein
LADYLRALVHEVRTVTLEMDLLEPQEQYRRLLFESSARLRHLVDRKPDETTRRM